ncbi:putative plasmepsin IX [Cryptosporidium felis]|nr:putative plasmepsin IX [Cryptosporidium felis]
MRYLRRIFYFLLIPITFHSVIFSEKYCSKIINVFLGGFPTQYQFLNELFKASFINNENENNIYDEKPVLELSGNISNKDIYKWSSSLIDEEINTQEEQEIGVDKEYFENEVDQVKDEKEEDIVERIDRFERRSTRDLHTKKILQNSRKLFTNTSISLINHNLTDIYNEKRLYKSIEILSVTNKKIPYKIYQTNIVIPLYEVRNSLFVCRIRIGEPEEQEFWPIIDTGSSNLWVIGEECTQNSCQKVKRYSKYVSRSFKRISKYNNISVTFGTGKIYGRLILETLKFDNFQLNQHVVGVIEQVGNTDSKIDVFDTIELEGVLGLGFTQMSSSKKLQLPLIERLQKQGLIKENIFSIYINDYRIKPIKKETRYNTPSALLLLGGIDDHLFENDLHLLPVIREHYWQVELESLYIGETKYCCDYGSLAFEWETLESEYLNNKFGPFEDIPMDLYIYKKYNKTVSSIKSTRTPGYVIFDSGTSFYTLPNFEYNHFINEYPPFGDCSQIHLEDRNKSNIDKKVINHFPNITYIFKDGFQLIIPPLLYLTPNEDGKCKPGFMMIDVPAEYGHSYLLGSLFMRSYYTVYAKNIPNIGSAVGIAKAKHGRETRKYIYSKLSSLNSTFVQPDDDDVELYWKQLNGKLSENWGFPSILNYLLFS